MPRPRALRRSLALPLLVVALFACRTTAPSPPPPAAAAVPAAAAAAPPAIAAPAAADDSWARGAVFYEVFVRSFADSDGDGVGDFNGLTAKLDYLNDGRPGGDDLGVDALWLMPVFASPSYHGYDTTDYERIDPEYGTEADFERFLAEAHRRGIRVILDFVMNHTSSQHPWFVDSASSPSSAHRDWYVWRADDPGWTQPWGGTNPTWHEKNGAFFYGVFWGGMPDLNFSTPAVRAEMERLAALWLRRGVDGFRLDATRHLFANGPGDEQNDQPETHAYLREFARAVHAASPEAMLVGENWTDTETIATYFGDPDPEHPGRGDELPFSFDFPLSKAIVDGVRDGDATNVAMTLDDIGHTYPPYAGDATFLTNHDMIRVATQLGGDAAKIRQAATILLTLPGTPFLYYGEELGLPNGPGTDDEAKRTPMPWTPTPPGFGFTAGARPWHGFAPAPEGTTVAEERARPDSVWNHYRALVALRSGSAALRSGDLGLLVASGDGAASLLAYVRRSGGETVLVVNNLGETDATAGLAGLAAPGERLFGDGSAAKDADGVVTVTVPAHASGIWRLRG